MVTSSDVPDVSSCLWLCSHAYLVIENGLAIPCPTTLGEIVDSSKLNKSWKDEGITDSNKPVHGSSISHFWQRVTGTDTQGGHSEYCSHTWWEKRNKNYSTLKFVSHCSTPFSLNLDFEFRLQWHWPFTCNSLLKYFISVIINIINIYNIYNFTEQ